MLKYAKSSKIKIRKKDAIVNVLIRAYCLPCSTAKNSSLCLQTFLFMSKLLSVWNQYPLLNSPSIPSADPSVP